MTWFADPTMGGGPADGFLRVQLDVVAKGAPLRRGRRRARRRDRRRRAAGKQPRWKQRRRQRRRRRRRRRRRKRRRHRLAASGAPCRPHGGRAGGAVGRGASACSSPSWASGGASRWNRAARHDCRAAHALLLGLASRVPLASCGGTSTAPIAPAPQVASASATAPAAPPRRSLSRPTGRTRRARRRRDPRRAWSSPTARSATQGRRRRFSRPAATRSTRRWPPPSRSRSRSPRRATSAAAASWSLASAASRTRSTSARPPRGAATRDMYLGPDGKPTHDSREGWRSVGRARERRGPLGGVAHARVEEEDVGRAAGAGHRSRRPRVRRRRRVRHGHRVGSAASGSRSSRRPRRSSFPAARRRRWARRGAIRTSRGVLRRIAAKGPAGFYEGPVADKLARAMKENGGLVTKEDLKAYRAKWRNADRVSTTAGGTSSACRRRRPAASRWR